MKLWAPWKEEGKPREIVRALTDEEQSVLRHRWAELELGCAPFTPVEEDRSIGAMAAMLNGFRSMRRDDDDVAVAGLDGLRRVLAPFPLWAIEKGCLAIQGGEASLNGKALSLAYPPNDAEIRGVIAEIVKPYLQLRDGTVALLAAPVRVQPSTEPKPTLNELKEKYGPSFGLDSAAAAPTLIDARIPVIDASRYSPEDLERLASHLKKQDAA